MLVASTGHKGYRSPTEACRRIAACIRQRHPRAVVETCPMADGGDGTLEVCLKKVDGHTVFRTVRDSLFRPCKIPIGIYHQNGVRKAIVEIASAAGSASLPPHERQTMVATSYGLGEALGHCMRLGCREVAFGLGGAIVSDAGLGMAQALGYKFFDRSGKRLQPLGNPGLNALNLSGVHSFQPPRFPVWRDLRIHVLADVHIRLNGPRGQARTFGPQKFALEHEVKYLEEGFKNLARVWQRVLGRDFEGPGSGAAGGLGAGMQAFLGGALVSGAAWCGSVTGLDAAIQRNQVVVTGEGKLDATTFFGKAPLWVAQRARRFGRPVLAAVETILISHHPLFQGIHRISDPQAMRKFHRLLAANPRRHA